MISQQLDNLIVSSFLLFGDHELLRQGQAYSNKSGLFYPENSDTQGTYTYSCSYLQLVNDTSISGANVMSGVYLNGVFVGIGTSGLYAINHYNGDVHFNAPLPKNTIVSGNFAVKDVNWYLSDGPDYRVIMEGKYASNPKYAQQATGIQLGDKVMPAIFLVPKEQEAKDLAFAGIDDNAMRIRAMVVCENVYQRVAVCGILKNLKLRQFPLVASTPFDYLGNMTGTNYNYNTLPYYGLYSPFVHKCKVTEIPNVGTFTDATKQFAMVDFDLSVWANHP
jgi:hypothetical protein